MDSRAPEVAGKIQNAVAAALESMTGFAVKAVNVHVGGAAYFSIYWSSSYPWAEMPLTSLQI